MMGYQAPCQRRLFYQAVNLESRVPRNHILRKIKDAIDFDFIYGEVKGRYGVNGNVSVPPPVIVKLMLLLILFNVRSERELMDTIPLRLDWLWFLGYDLDSEVPNHSVLSKARTRWGVEAFRVFFEYIVWQCVEAGLVDGRRLFVDSSLIDADASNNSVVDSHSLGRYLKRGYKRLEERLDDLADQKATPADSRYISTTDPDASVTKHKGSRSKLRYKTHRGVDASHEVITATQITPGCRDEGDLLKEMIGSHEHNVQRSADTVVGDSRYGKNDNYLLCHDLGKKAHIASLKETQKGTGRQKDIFAQEAFVYDSHGDRFICPAGHILRRRHYYKRRRHYEYQASRSHCANCQVRKKCTRAKGGRTIKRHVRQDDLDIMLKIARSRAAKADLRTRQHLSERSFAQSMRYGFKRARWRGLWRVQIQDYLIAAVQNIKILVDHLNHRYHSMANEMIEQRFCSFERIIYFIWIGCNHQHICKNT